MNRSIFHVRIRLLLLALLPLLAAPAWSAEKARILTSFEDPANCISKVEINSVDGKDVRVPPGGLTLEPGEHALTGRAIINTAFCRTVASRKTAEPVPPLEAEFEAGKTYYVGYDHSSSNRDDWQLVIWKVKDS